MGCRKYSFLMTVAIYCFLFLFMGCSSEKEQKGNATITNGPSAMTHPLPATGSALPVPALPVPPSSATNVIIDVDGAKLTQGEIDSEIKQKMHSLKGQIPEAKKAQVQAEMRKQMINDFTVRTLLTNEVNRTKISATDQEVSEAIERLKGSLPQGMTIEALMKKNNLTKRKLNDEIRFGIKINKLVISKMAAKSKPTEVEISKFYQKNKDKFTVPESVHVRHILVAKAATDDSKMKSDKKAKANDLRKQLMSGSDFAELAKKYSDCPSKNNGGDLGIVSRGQMVKPFEQAAFSQGKNDIGPVIETEFGYHVIQVLEKNGPKVMDLDESAKAKISAFIQQQKQQETFVSLVKKLREKANIVVYQN